VFKAEDPKVKIVGNLKDRFSKFENSGMWKVEFISPKIEWFIRSYPMAGV
jgi:hypothetical protein